MGSVLDKEADIPLYSPTCTLCRHWVIGKEKRRCTAFPNRIPMPIWRGENDHQLPYPGDNGIQFEKAAPKDVSPTLGEAESG